jgi:3-oxoacyl-[acyl-carrier protein] reductase
LRTVLITGASRGIGAAIAEALATPDTHLHLLARAVPEALVANLRAKAAAVTVHAVDLAKDELPELPAVDVVVNNAAQTHDGLVLRLKDSAYLELFALNFMAAMRLSRACLREMLKRDRGRIINISSLAATHGNPGQAAYAASKAALEAFTRTLAREVAQRGITVNAVAPGFIDTDMTASLKEEWKKAIAKRSPLGRFGRAEEVAEVVRFLASDESSYVTGQVIDVAGGIV